MRPCRRGEAGKGLFSRDKDRAGPAGVLTDVGPLGTPPAVWHHGFLFSPALTIGGGTAEVQRSIIAERNEDAPGRSIQRDFHLDPGERVLVVDDVLTTGGSVRETIEAVRDAGGGPGGGPGHAPARLDRPRPIAESTHQQDVRQRGRHVISQVLEKMKRPLPTRVDNIEQVDASAPLIGESKIHRSNGPK